MKLNRLSGMIALILFAVTAAPSLASDLWLHVRVDEAGESKVTLNLPLNLVEAAMPMIPDSIQADGQIELGDWNVTSQELQHLWSELRNGPDMTFVTVEDGGDDVRVWKEGDYFKLRASEKNSWNNETVDVRVPLAVIDALLSGNGGGEFNIQGAIRALVAHGEGELVTISGDNEQVRIWVDDVAQAN